MVTDEYPFFGLQESTIYAFSISTVSMTTGVHPGVGVRKDLPRPEDRNTR